MELGGNGKSQNRLCSQQRVLKVRKGLRTKSPDCDCEILGKTSGKNVKVLRELFRTHKRSEGLALQTLSVKGVAFRGLFPSSHEAEMGLSQEVLWCGVKAAI